MICVITVVALLMLLAATTEAADVPFALHPDNPHYFLFRGKPTLLITSGEHYGAVLNLDFDYAKYLDTLRAEGMNHTRTFVGAYCEPDGAFSIARNTLAPAPGRFICPWARSEQPGYANGGNKFDLSQWDAAYFARLKDFVTKARDRGIVIEVNLFCPFYGEEQWVLSPMTAQQHQRHRADRPGRGLHARSDRGHAGSAGGDGPPDRHRAERLRQRVLRGHE